MRTLLSYAFCFVLFNGFSQQTSNTIKGVITYGDYPLVNASIVIKGTSQGVESGINGNYVIEARPREVLVFSYVGMQTVEIMVEDVTRILNLSMVHKIEELDEVVVTKSKRKTQEQLKLEYKTNKNIINSSFGLMDKDATALYLRTLDGNELNPAAIDLVSAINGKFSGIEGSSWYNSTTGRSEPVIYVRRRGRLVFEVDGMFMKQVPEIDVAMIERIGVIVGTAAARRYGGDGNTAGVMIINTKKVENGLKEDSGLPYDRAKLRDNVFNNDALSQTSVLKNESLYLKTLNESKSIEDALAVYEKHRVNHGDSYYFFTDTYRFIMEQFGDKDKANSIIANHKDLFKENPVALKALAYVYQANGDFKRANELYKEIFIQRPNYGQSYMDLANSFQELGDSKKAAALNMRYDYLLNEGFLVNDSTAFTQIMDRELNNLLTINGRDILSKRDYKKALLKEDFNGTRLVFEWNDSEAEFELQFVNPQGRYFTTTHSLATDAERIYSEKLIGYSCEEFLIDGSLAGTWQVNAKYLGNKSLTPTYMKATVYYNYGSADQRKETRVFKLGLKNVNQELFKVNNTPSIKLN